MRSSLIRCTSILLAACLAAPLFSAPSQAMTTAQEVAQGRAESAQVDAHSIKVTDPFLVSWVNSIGSQLAQHRQRKDINFSFTILASPDINAFAMKGGFIHVDMGLLNFVSSDDELAATMGHEMGHVELRHVVKQSNQATIIGILSAIASIFSPITMVLGGLGGELASDKFSRLDELQADHYGLRLATEAGFDPQAAVDVMSKLGSMDPGPGSRADKAFIDHPVPQDRVAHLLGYAELDKPTDGALTGQAIHDQKEGRYSYAQAKLKKVQAHAPSTLVSEHITQLDYALRESGALAAPDGRVMLASVNVDDPHRVQAALALRNIQKEAQDALTQAKTNARTGLGELDNLEQQLSKVSNGMQGGAQGPQAVNSAGVATTNSMAHLDADITGAMDAINDVLTTAPGLVGPNQDALREMAYPLAEPAPLTPKYQALLSYYPMLTSGLGASTNLLLDSMAQARDAIAQGLDATQVMSGVFAAMGPPPQGEQFPAASPRPLNLGPAISAWDAVLAKAQHASDEMYAAQSTGLSAEISLLDVESSPERYKAFRDALEYRFPGTQPLSYAQALQVGLPPGEIACASWFAFDTHKTVNAVIAGLKSSNESCEDAALSRHLLGESMEIAEGLVYEDYTDAPQPAK